MLIWIATSAMMALPANAAPCENSLALRFRRTVVAAVSLGMVGATGVEPVDLQLVLATDVSGSIDVDEYRIQQEGVATALRSPEVRRSIQRCAPRGVAMAYLEWDQLTDVVVPFTRLLSPESLDRFAKGVERHYRERTTGSTDIEQALLASRRLLDESRLVAGRRVIDISSDGIQNVDRMNDGIVRDHMKHERLGWTRDAIVAADVTINGLVIDRGVKGSPNAGEKSLEAYFQRRVTGGADSFTLKIASSSDVAEGLSRKLSREICSGVNF